MVLIHRQAAWRLRSPFSALLGALTLAACGGGAAGDSGARVRDDPQSISFASAPALQVAATATVQASASSGLLVSFSSLTPAVCSVDASSGQVAGLAIGVCSIAANQGGNDHFAPAPQASLNLTVSGRSQSIRFDTLPALVIGATITIQAQASSGLPVRYTSLTPDTCSIDPSSGATTGLSSGACNLAAEQSGDALWAAAAQATQSLSVDLRPQAIDFASLSALQVGTTVNVQATASSGLPVSFTSQTPAVCSVAPNSASVAASAAGTCTIAADQVGDGQWARAAQVLRSVTVARGTQRISFDAAPTSPTVGSTVTVRAAANSGLAVSYSSLTPTACSVSAVGLVTSLTAGTCTIAANQAGNANWLSADQATQTLSVLGKAQSISFGAAPALTVGGTATVRALAGSGLAVVYSSLTPSLCTVDAATGVVKGMATGACNIAADQAGNASWAAAPRAIQVLTVAPNPNQTLSFAAAPSLTLGGTATVRATASSGLAVVYSSLSAIVCSVQSTSGVVTGNALGDCVIAANQAGNSSVNPAPQVTLTLAVSLPAGTSTPGTPQGVTAKLGNSAGTVIISVGSINSGGSPVSGYTVVSNPAGITAQSATTPVSVNCPSSCSGYAFSIYGSNAAGAGSASAPVNVLTTFDVVTTFYEPDTQPRDSIFTGSFTLNSTTGAVTNLTGRLTESMSGNAIGSAPFFDMIQVPLNYQLQTWRDAALGGSFVASFAKNTTSTFTATGGGDGWSPEAGVANGGVYAGFPAAYGGTIKNSSILIFVPDNPFTALTAAQIAKLAYADCAPGGMMGAVCMTATSMAGYGAIGTMSGYPVSQSITRR